MRLLPSQPRERKHALEDVGAEWACDRDPIYPQTPSGIFSLSPLLPQFILCPIYYYLLSSTSLLTPFFPFRFPFPVTNKRCAFPLGQRQSRAARVLNIVGNAGSERGRSERESRLRWWQTVTVTSKKASANLSLFFCSPSKNTWIWGRNVFFLDSFFYPPQKKEKGRRNKKWKSNLIHKACVIEFFYPLSSSVVSLFFLFFHTWTFLTQNFWLYMEEEEKTAEVEEIEKYNRRKRFK